MATTIAGRDAILELLIDEGVEHLFGNPGTTELALMQALGAHPQLKYVLGLQEAVVLGMADGYARASGRLAACNLHCAPGLGNAMGALYGAKFSGSPILVTAGQYEIGYGLQEPLLYEPLAPIAQPLVKWATEVPRVEDLPRIIRRAAKVALAPPTGPVFVSLPGSVLDAEAPLEMGRPTRVEAGVRPDDDLLQRICVRLLAAERPVVIAGSELARRDAWDEAGELATLLGAAVYHEPVAYNARYPTAHPAFVGDLTRNQRKVRETLAAHDLLLCLGADLLRMSPASPVNPLPPGLPVIHLSERDWELGKNYPTDLAVRADVKRTLGALLPLVRSGRTHERAIASERRIAELATRNWTARRVTAARDVEPLACASPLDQRYAMLRIADALPESAVVVEEVLTPAPALASFLHVRDPRCYYGLASGGLGFAMPGAIGVSLAQRDRPVVALVGDGSAMYGIQALWTAGHLRLPITWVVFANGSYRILKERLLANRRSDRYVGMELKDPPLDFVAIARGFGVEAKRIETADGLDASLRAIDPGRGPALLVADGP
jgi:benzoylformate decarboxylase